MIRYNGESSFIFIDIIITKNVKVKIRYKTIATTKQTMSDFSAVTYTERL